MRFYVITIFPEIIETYLKFGIISRAINNKIVEVNIVNLRNYSSNKYGKIDDEIIGHGRGMLFTPEPLDNVIIDIKKKEEELKIIYLTPQGLKFENKKAKLLSSEKCLLLICGRYEGIDSRIINKWVDEEISIGDYILTGGEIPALVLIDSITRFLDNSIKKESVECESFENGLLEYDHYTHPILFDNMEVPKVLREGNHKEIEEFRFFNSLKKTYFNRIDLIRSYKLILNFDNIKNKLKKIKKINEKLLNYLEKMKLISKEWKYANRK